MMTDPLPELWTIVRTHHDGSVDIVQNTVYPYAALFKSRENAEDFVKIVCAKDGPRWDIVRYTVATAESEE